MNALSSSAAATFEAADNSSSDAFRAFGQTRTEVHAAARVLRHCGHGTRWLNGWDSLTPAEHRVTCLAAQRFSNTEIADALGISRRTAENHLARVFTKLGIRSRARLRDTDFQSLAGLVQR